MLASTSFKKTMSNMSTVTSTVTRGWLASRCAIGLALALGLLFACQRASTPSTGGETHFLRLCADDDPTSCGPDLTCVCNVCTVPCTSDDACSGLGGAVCAERSDSSCGSASQVRACEVECREDDDCSSLSAQHRCDDGACRASQGASSPPPDAAPSPPPPDPASDAATDACAPSVTTADELIVIGDSFFAASREITRQLEALARSAGLLPEGSSLRDYSQLIDNSLALAGPGIANQYAEALAQGAVRAVVMNGGGADAILGSCETPDANCPVVSAAVSAAEELLTRMQDDGVLDVVYAYYPNPLNDAQRVMVDALRAPLEAVCRSAPLRCHWIDLRPAFEGNYDEYVSGDGLNPTTAGATATASEIWNALVTNCVVPGGPAQP